MDADRFRCGTQKYELKVSERYGGSRIYLDTPEADRGHAAEKCRVLAFRSSRIFHRLYSRITRRLGMSRLQKCE